MYEKKDKYDEGAGHGPHCPLCAPRRAHVPSEFTVSQARYLNWLLFSAPPMRRLLLTALGLCTAAVCSTVDSYVASESPFAKTGLLANIGPSGSMSSGAYVSVTF